MQSLNFTNTQVASSETARDINRSVVLNLVRRRQPISRADLARISGLQRSTVSLITEQLIREKWVVMGPVGRLPRGRRPTFLRLNDKRAILVADLRPIQTTVAVADASGRFLSQESFQTPAEPHKTIAALASRFRHQMSLHKNLDFEGIGISLPGRFDEVTQRVIFAPNLKWSGVDLGAPIKRATGLRVELENAANACVLAEAWFGLTEHARGLVVVTVSEGVGAGMFIDGHLVRGQLGMAGEFGHIPVDPNGPPCTCGNRGCWEVYASTRAALRYYHESGRAPDDFTFQDLLALSEAGNALAGNALEKMAQAIGRGMRMVVMALAPEEIVVVGEFTRQWRRLGPVIEAEAMGTIPVGDAPRIRPAAVDPRMARLRGAVALVLQKHFGLGQRPFEDANRSRRGVA
jgi:predicted NBD/HSP70 family sugar kinase